MSSRMIGKPFRTLTRDREIRARVSASAGYDAGGTGRRARGWVTSPLGPNSLLQQDAERIRDRSRHAVRNNPWAGNAIDSFVASCIGSGIKLQSEEPAIQEAWRRWMNESDFDGLLDFYGQQSLAARTMMEAGEVLAQLVITPGEGAVPLKVRLLEPDFLPFWQLRGRDPELKQGHEIKAGIEMDATGRRVAYHLYKTHPGEMVFSRSAGMETVRIPAAEIIHCFQPLRPGQLRGQPWLTRVLTKLYELESYDDSELARKSLAAKITGFITGAGEAFPDDGNSTSSLIKDTALEPGTFMELGPEEDVKFAEASDVGGMYEVFMRTQLRAVAAGIGITYEQLTGDLTGVNYSSIRAGLLEFRRRVEQIQYQIFAYQFCRRIFNQWLFLAVNSRAIELKDYAKRRAEYEDVRWITPGFAWVDPLKDITASVMAIRAGLTTRATVVSEQGEDVEQIDREQAEDNARADAMGLSHDSDGRRPESQPQADRTNAALAGTANEENQDRRKREIVQ